MSWDDEFERELLRYSEVETIPIDQVKPTVPQTIKLYQQRIKSNNCTSIFDTDYTLDGPASNSDSAQELNKKIEEDMGVLKDEKVTYIISGRGRGGRNILVNPGEFSKSKTFNGDDEVRQQIRKVAPIGYSNEITESAVRAHKMAKVLERDSNANINSISPTVSKPSSPAVPKIISPAKPSSPGVSNTVSAEKPSSPAVSETILAAKPSSPAVSKTISAAKPSSPAESKTISADSSGDNDISSTSSKTKSKTSLNGESSGSSSNSTPTRASDVRSSDYFTSQDHNVSSSSSKSDQDEYETEESEDESSEASSAVASNIPIPSFNVNTEANEKKKIPLSVMLRQSREAHKKKQLALENGSEEHINELASKQIIAAILRQDHLERQISRKKQRSDASSSSLSSRDETLSWRRRNNSPPRYSWGSGQGEGCWRSGNAPKKLNINSTEEFPTLK